MDWLQSKYDQGDFFAEVSATRYLKIESCDAAHLQSIFVKPPAVIKRLKILKLYPWWFYGVLFKCTEPARFSTNLTLGTRLLDQRLVFGGRYTYSAAAMNTLNKPWQTVVTTPQMKYQSVGIIDLFADCKLINMQHWITTLQNTIVIIRITLARYMPAPGRTISLGFKLFL